MKKILTILIILLIPFLLTACLKKPGSDSAGGKTESKSDKETSKDSDSDGSKKNASLFDLIKGGVPQHCTGSFEQEGGKFEIDVYTSGKKSYMEQKISSPDLEKDMMSYMIYDGEWMYTWGDLYGMASKIKMEAMEKMAEEFSEYAKDDTDTRKSTMDFQKKLDYTCKPWVPDSGKFNPPAGIDFVDYSQEMSQQMEEMKDWMDSGGMDQLKQDTCEMCESLPTQEAIDSCKERVGC